MVADPTIQGARTAVKTPVVVALVTVVIALLAGLIPSIWSYSARNSDSTENAEGAIVSAAETAQKNVRGFVDAQSSSLGCLVSDTHLEAQITKSLEPEPEIPESDDDDDDDEEESPEVTKAKATLEAIKAAREAVQGRLKGYCSGRETCKRVVLASKTSAVLFSTEGTDDGATLGGSLVSNAISSGTPTSMVSEGLEDQLGAPVAVAAAMPSKEYVVIGAFDMSRLVKGLSKLKASLGTGARIVLVDGRRMALHDGLESQEGKALEIEPVARALRGESATAQTADEEDKVVFAAFRPIAESGMAVVAMRRIDDMESSSAPFPWGGLIGAFVFGLIGALILFVIVRKAFDPLGLLYQACARVAKGDLSERVPVLTDDEVGAISRVWNDVVARLQKAEGGAPSGQGGESFPPNDGDGPLIGQ